MNREREKKKRFDLDRPATVRQVLMVFGLMLVLLSDFYEGGYSIFAYVVGFLTLSVGFLKS